MEILNIGSTPYDEPCAQVGSINYRQLARAELVAFIGQCRRALNKQFGDTLLVDVKGTSFPHDFGTYHEVVVMYDPNNEQQVQQAFWLESADISKWDDEAKEYLQSCGYTLHLES